MGADSGLRHGRGARRVGVRALQVVAVLVAVALLAAGAGYAWLSTDGGRSWLLAEILRGVDRSIAGDIRARSLTLEGLSYSVHALEARSPDGELVATADRLGPLPLLPLLERQIVLDGAELSGAHLFARVGEAEVNLASTFEPSAGGGGAGLVLRDLRVVGGSIRATQDRWRAAPRSANVKVERGSVTREDAGAPLVVELDGDMQQPLTGRFRGQLRVDRGGGPVRIAVDVPGGATDLAVTTGSGSMEVTVNRLAIAPQTGRDLAPGYPVRVPIELEGRVRRSGPALEAAMSGTAGDHPLRASARAELGARVRVAELEGEIAGASFSGRGALGGGAPPEGSAAVEIPSVERLGEAIRALTGVDSGLQGAGEVELELDSVRRLVHMRASFERLARGAASAEELTLRGALGLDDLHGHATVRAAHARVGGAHATGLRGELRRDGRGLAAEFRASRRAGDLVVRATGEVLAGGNALRLDSLFLRAGAQRWALATRSASVARRGSGVVVEGLALRSGPRRVSVSGFASGERLDLLAGVRNLPLAGVAEIAGWPVGGTVSGSLRITGELPDPALRFRVVVDGGRVAGLAGIAGTANARREPGGPLVGRAALRRQGMRVSGEFRIPLRGAALAADAPLRADLRFSSTLDVAKELARRSLPLSGDFAGRLALRGTASDLRVDGRVSARCLRVAVHPSSCTAVTVRAGTRGVELDAVATWEGRSARLSATTAVEPVRLARLVARGETSEIPISADLTADDLPAAKLFCDAAQVACDREQRLAGTISVRASASGTLARPEARTFARLDGLGLDGGPSLHGAATARYALGKLRADARLRSTSGGVLDAEAVLDVDGATALARSPLALRVTAEAFEPAPLAVVIPGVEALGGELGGALRLSGTAAAPRAEGSLAWRAGRLWTRDFGRYDELALRIEAGERGALAVDATAVQGRGEIALQARRAAGAAGDPVRGELTLRRFAVVWQGRVWAHADAELPFRVELGDRELRVDVELGGSDIHLPYHAGSGVQPLDRPAGIVLTYDGLPLEGEPVDPGARVVPERRASGAPLLGRTVRLVLGTSEPVHVRGKGVDLELLVSRDFTMRWTDRLMVFGSLTAPSGSVEAMGGSFALLSGSELRFEGPPEAPFVDLGASGSLGGGELSLFAHGRRGELQLGAGGDREASELAIYSLLATGEAQLARGAPRPLAHSRVEGAGWGSALARYLATQFPLDALLGRGTPSSTHEASAVVTGQVEARAIARLGADPLRGENARANEIAVRLGPDARIRARFGDAAAAGLDVLWIHERQPGGAGPNNPDARAEHRSARRPRPQRR